jgi:hypothetical protein
MMYALHTSGTSVYSKETTRRSVPEVCRLNRYAQSRVLLITLAVAFMK